MGRKYLGYSNKKTTRSYTEWSNEETKTIWGGFEDFVIPGKPTK